MAEFDQFGSDYRQRLEQSIGGLGSVDSALSSKIQILKKLADSDVGWSHRPILDFGCGAGLLTGLLVQLSPDAFGADVSLLSMKQAKPETGRFLQFDGRHLPIADNSFGMVVASCVFHHILPAERPVIMQEICRVLEPGGYVVIIEHNPFNPLTRFVVNRCEFDADAQLLTLGSTRKMLRGAGLTSSSDGYFYAVPPVGPGLSRIDHGLRRLPVGAQYYCAFQKPDDWQPLTLDRDVS